MISMEQDDPVSCTGENSLSAKTENQHCRRVFQKLAALEEIDRTNDTVIPLSKPLREKNDAEILFDSVKSLHEKGEGDILYDSVNSMMLHDSVQSRHQCGGTLVISSGGQHSTAVDSTNVLCTFQSKCRESSVEQECLKPSAEQTFSASVAAAGPTSAASVSAAGPTPAMVSAVAIVVSFYCCCIRCLLLCARTL